MDSICLKHYFGLASLGTCLSFTGLPKLHKEYQHLKRVTFVFQKKKKKQADQHLQTSQSPLLFTQLIFPLQEGNFSHHCYLGLFEPILCSAPRRLHELLNLVGGSTQTQRRSVRARGKCHAAEIRRPTLAPRERGGKWRSPCSSWISPSATPCGPLCSL